MRLSKKHYLLIIIFYQNLIISCGVNPIILGSRLGTSNTSSAKSTIAIADTRNNIIPLSCKIGESLGYKVSFKTDYSVSLYSGTSNATSVFLASTKQITITVWKDEKDYGILVTTYADWGRGGNEYAENILKEFKDKLLEEIKKGS